MKKNYLLLHNLTGIPITQAHYTSEWLKSQRENKTSGPSGLEQ
jgi:hypothetical protein